MFIVRTKPVSEIAHFQFDQHPLGRQKYDTQSGVSHFFTIILSRKGFEGDR